MRRIGGLLLSAIFLLYPKLGSASTIVNFESLNDSDVVTNQIPGLAFVDATVLTAGVSLNEFEFPPHSGANVVFDDGGPMSIVFAVPQLTVGGYFNYVAGLTFQAFDASHTLLGSQTSSFTSNLALSGEVGSTPNEFLQFTSVTGIGSITITADPGGNSFTLDDLTLTPLANGTPVPEPTTLVLVLTGAAAAWRRTRTRANELQIHT
jgi:PEP-CTERM motif